MGTRHGDSKIGMYPELWITECVKHHSFEILKYLLDVSRKKCPLKKKVFYLVSQNLIAEAGRTYDFGIKEECVKYLRFMFEEYDMKKEGRSVYRDE